jgi:hypothetical protein
VSALCSIHAEQAAIATCSRCGNFVCETCLPAGMSICATCTKRFDAEPLDLAIRWATRRVSLLKMTIGVCSTLVGVGLGISVVWYAIGGWVGGIAAAGLVVLSISLGRWLTSLLLRVLAPYWITRARERFGLHEDVLQELRVVLR